MDNSQVSVRILIAGDTPAKAQAMSSAIQHAYPACEVNYIYLPGREPIDKAARFHPDIMIFDLKSNSISTILEIKKKNPAILFICIAPRKNYDLLYDAMKLGIHHFYVQPVDSNMLIDIISKCAEELYSKASSERREIHLSERLEDATRIIRRDYLMSMMPDAIRDRRQGYYANFLGLTDQLGFIAVIICRKNPTYKVPESVIYRISTLYNVIGSSINPGLGMAFFPIDEKNDPQKQQLEIVNELDKILMQFHVSGNNVISGIGGITEGTVEMRYSVQQALAATNYYSTNTSPYRYCIIFDPESMYIPSGTDSGSNSSNSTPAMKWSIDQAIRYIEMHYAKPLTLQDVAAHINLSPYYFSRTFKKYTGLNFSKFLINVRIENAKALLASGERDIKSVAWKVGFSDPNYFSRVFHSATGSSPSKYEES